MTIQRTIHGTHDIAMARFYVYHARASGWAARPSASFAKTYSNTMGHTMSMMCTLLKVGCALTALSGPSTIEGKATVQDGDTIYVSGQAVRLAGVDAPELSEPFGIRAKLALRQIIGDREVRCVFNGPPSYSRSVASCYIGDAEINRSIIATGFALDCPRYSGGLYRREEAPNARARLVPKPYC